MDVLILSSLQWELTETDLIVALVAVAIMLILEIVDTISIPILQQKWLRRYAKARGFIYRDKVVKQLDKEIGKDKKE